MRAIRLPSPDDLFASPVSQVRPRPTSPLLEHLTCAADIEVPKRRIAMCQAHSLPWIRFRPSFCWLLECAALQPISQGHIAALCLSLAAAAFASSTLSITRITAIGVAGQLGLVHTVTSNL